ncbi:MAG: VTT domain-containing protein [Gammaproteobacteria bacterium]|nr:VTT domain-containing protein [Gammaproteobacteria bacterium]
MMAWVHTLIDFVSMHPMLAIVTAFLVAFGEALFVVGLFVPSSVVLVGIGGLVGLGTLSFWPVFLATTAGAVAGDGVSYLFGHRYRARLLDMWPFSRYRDLVASGQRFFARHGGKSVVIGRFIPGIKSVVPGIAGMMGMGFTRFTVLNVTSAFAWAGAHLLPGMSAGWAMLGLASISKRLAALVALLLILGLLSSWLARNGLKRLVAALTRGRVAAAHWASRRDDRIGHLVSLLVAPHYGDLRVLVGLNLVLLALMLGFVMLLVGVLTQDQVVVFDRAFSQFLQSLRTSWSDRLMVAVTMLGDPGVVCVVLVAMLTGLLLARRTRLAAGLLIALLSSVVFVQALKVLVHAQRPIAIYSGASAFSFPSGHATINAVLYGILALLFLRGGRGRAGRIAAASCVVLIGAIAFSRIYLAAHWPSDVIAGLLFAAGVIAIVSLVYRQSSLDAVVCRRLMVGCAAALLVYGGWHVNGGYTRAQAFYATRPEPAVQMVGKWRDGGWRSLPRDRIDLSGEAEEPFVLQWRGDGASLESALVVLGWHVAPSWSIGALNAYVNPASTASTLPVLPRLHNGRTAELTLIKPARLNGRSGRYVLRAWQQRVRRDGVDESFLLVSMSFEQLIHPLGQLSLSVVPDELVCDGSTTLGSLPKATVVDRSRTVGEDGCGGALVLARAQG